MQIPAALFLFYSPAKVFYIPEQFVIRMYCGMTVYLAYFDELKMVFYNILTNPGCFEVSKAFENMFDLTFHEIYSHPGISLDINSLN